VPKTNSKGVELGKNQNGLTQAQFAD